MAQSRLIQVPADQDLLEVLRKTDFGHDAWVQGIGALQNAEIRVAGDAMDPRRALKGRSTLLSLMGPASGPYMVILARATPTGVETLGGALLMGTSKGVTLAVTDLIPHGAEEGRGLSTASAPEDEEPGGPSPRARTDGNERRPVEPPASAWSQIATATVLREATPEDETDEWPEPGDQVQHFHFGLCDVLRLVDGRVAIRPTTGASRVREISLAHVIVTGPRLREGMRVFSLKKKGS